MGRKPHPLDLDPSVYLRDDYVCLDFETTNLDRGSPVNRDNRVVLAVWRLARNIHILTGLPQNSRVLWKDESPECLLSMDLNTNSADSLEILKTLRSLLLIMQSSSSDGYREQERTYEELSSGVHR